MFGDFLFYCFTILNQSRFNLGFLHGCVKRTGYSVRGRAPFIPMKVAQWCMKPKKSFPAVRKINRM